MPVTHACELHLTLAPVEDYNLFDEGRDPTLNLYKNVAAVSGQMELGSFNSY